MKTLCCTVRAIPCAGMQMVSAALAAVKASSGRRLKYSAIAYMLWNSALNGSSSSARWLCRKASSMRPMIARKWA